MAATPAPSDDPFHSPTPEALEEMAKGEGLFSEQWIAKTASPIGVDPTQAPPEMRYQLLQGRLHTLQRFPSGAIARGEIDPTAAPFALDQEGWYGADGEFLGDDPAFPDWE